MLTVQLSSFNMKFYNSLREVPHTVNICHLYYKTINKPAHLLKIIIAYAEEFKVWVNNLILV